MIRTKILGPERFSHRPFIPSIERNLDLGHFSIGPGEVTTMIEEPLKPPKQLWIRAKIHAELCPDIPVIGKNSHFIWQGNPRLAAIKLESVQILCAQKSNNDTHWHLLKDQTMYRYEFAVAPTIYDVTDGLHLWPCGGDGKNILEAEQLFAQIGSSAPEMFVNKYSSWKKHLDATAGIVFEPPNFNEASLLDEIKSGKFLAQIEKNGQQFSFASCRAEPSNDCNFIDILCERTSL